MLKKVIFLFILLIFFVKPLYASDKNIICNDIGCFGYSGSLFSEVGLVPGDSVNKSISFKNERNEDLELELKIKENAGTDNNLKEKTEIIIKEDDGNIVFSGSFKNLIGQTLNLGSLLSNQTKIYEFSAKISPDIFNEYQNKKINFDIAITVKGKDSVSTQVLSSNILNESSISPFIEEKPLGSVLGFSDTGGLKIVLFFFIFGYILTPFGIKLIFGKK